jgi:hypothetical protein
MSEWIVCAWAWADTHPGVAAWVQAIFSIIAILIAFYVPYRQHLRDVRLARQLRVEDRLRSMEAAAAIVIHAMNLIEDAWNGTKKPDDTCGYVLMVHEPAAFDFAASALKEINLANVSDWELIRPIIGMRNLLIEAKRLPVAIHEADERRYTPPDEVRERLRCVREEAHRHTSIVEAAVNRLREEICPAKGD